MLGTEASLTCRSNENEKVRVPANMARTTFCSGSRYHRRMKRGERAGRQLDDEDADGDHEPDQPDHGADEHAEDAGGRRGRVLPGLGHLDAAVEQDGELREHGPEDRRQERDDPQRLPPANHLVGMMPTADFGASMGMHGSASVWDLAGLPDRTEGERCGG